MPAMCAAWLGGPDRSDCLQILSRHASPISGEYFAQNYEAVPFYLENITVLLVDFINMYIAKTYF